MDPSRISFSTAITMNSHNRNNRILKEKIGTLYFDLLYRYWVVRENYVLSHAMIPRPYRSVRGTDDDEPRPVLSLSFASYALELSASRLA